MSSRLPTDRPGPGGHAFAGAEDARTWLLGRLDRLELSVRDSAELQKMSALLTGDALSQLEADPLTFRKASILNLRDLLTQVTEGAAARTEREGFNVAALERLVMKTLGESPSRGRDVMAGLTHGLRERVAELSRHGNEDYEAAQSDLDQGLLSLDQALDTVVRRWENAPLGFFGRWSRRRRLRKQGLDAAATLPELQLMLADAGRDRRASFESAMEHAARAGTALGIVKSYSDVLEWLLDSLQNLERAAAFSRELSAEAAHAFEQMDGAWRSPELGDRINGVTEEVIDQALDALKVTPEAFFARTDLSTTGLARESRRGFEADIERWVSHQVAKLGQPDLADVLAGFDQERDITGALAGLLTAGQPLIRFNDDLHRLWPEGLAAQYYVIAEASDDSVGAALSDACVQVGLPAPLVEVVATGRRDRDVSPAAEGTMQVRVIQMVAGLAWLSEAERLMPMVEVHRDVMAEADKNLETREGLRAALRDTVDSEQLEGILPEQVLTALRKLRGIGVDTSPNATASRNETVQAAKSSASTTEAAATQSPAVEGKGKAKATKDKATKSKAAKAKAKATKANATTAKGEADSDS